MSLVSSFFNDAYQLKQHILELKPNFIWNFHVPLSPLIYDNDDDKYIQRYSDFMNIKYVKPLKNLIDCNVSDLDIPHEIYKEIIEFKIGTINDHYLKYINCVINSNFMIPIIFGYLQLFLIISFCTITVYYENNKYFNYESQIFQVSLSFMIFIISFIISTVNLCGILISFYKSNQYSQIIHKFQMKLYNKDNDNLSFIDNDYNNILVSYIPFQKWLNICPQCVELNNYKFLFPKKNIALILLVLGKYWISTYIQFVIILSHIIYLKYDIAEETQTIFIAIGLIICGLILFYCHLRVTFYKTIYDSIWYLFSLLSAIIIFLFIEIILIFLLEQFFTINIDHNIDHNINHIINDEQIQTLEPNVDIYGMEMQIIDTFIDYLNLNNLFIYIIIPTLYSIFIVGWLYIIEYRIFFPSSRNNVLNSVTMNNLNRINLMNISWTIKGNLFDLYYFMPFYRCIYIYLCFVYLVYIGVIFNIWFPHFEGFWQFVFLFAIFTIIAVIYIYIQQQIQCLMSGLNEYQFALKFIHPNSLRYFWGHLRSLILF